MAKFDFGSMQRFIRQFDPIEHKYLRIGKKETGGELRQALEKELPPRCNERWTLDETEDTYQTLQMVYGQQESEFCEIVKAASEKFLGEYVGIEGIGQLFRSSYFYFEWMMHLEYSKKEHDYTYYRDHYVHQVRNMYEMFVILDELGYEDLCRRLYGEMHNKVGELVRDSVWRELHRPSAEWETAWNLTASSQEERERMLYGYLFYTAAIMASLLHDIGYPIAYIGRTVRELGEFVPFSHLFVQEVETISTIHSVLQDSLLYRVAGQKEVAERVGKKDHGALSAVILLYKYYDSGKITDLPPVSRAAVELAALMIYNHTLKYRNLGQKSGNYKNIFRENPMSFLFRLCDDLQEWNRVYFDISRRSNFFVCGSCLMPLTRNPEESAVLPAAKERGYSCWCGENRGKNTTMFAYRRLINVDACTFVEIQIGKRSQRIRIVYDKGKLLQIAAYNAAFAMKRAEGAWEIKKMLEGQPGFPDTFLEFFVSNNPILLKAEILAEWLKKHDGTFDGVVTACMEEINGAGKTAQEKLAALEHWVGELLEEPDEPEMQGEGEEREWAVSKKGEGCGGPSELGVLWNDKKKALKEELKRKLKKKAEEEREGMPEERDGEFGEAFAGLEGVLPESARTGNAAADDGEPEGRTSVDYMWEKSYFYFCMAFVGEILQRMDKKVWCESKDDAMERGKLKDAVKGMEDMICRSFHIVNSQETKLTGLALYHKARQFDWEQFEKTDSEEERELYLSAFQHNCYDMDLVTSYVSEDTYGKIKRDAWRRADAEKPMKLRYDYYSDYYLYYTIAEML